MQKAFNNAALVASIHDVSSITRERTQEILNDLHRIGVDRTSLLVIPNHHHRGLISDDSDFKKWIREKVAEGHETVLHGFYHLREQRQNDDVLKRLVTQSYTAGEGEFFDLTQSDATNRLQAGRAAMEHCGLSATGFIAPAWLLGEEAESAVRELGFEYTTRISTISDFKTNRIHHARSLVWSVRAGWRRVCSLAWNQTLFLILQNAPLLRIGIHPPDWDHPAIRKQIMKFAGAALAARKAITYQDWLLEQRSLS